MTVAELLESPERWTREAVARDSKGLSTYAEDPKAVCWCLAGAILKCYPEGFVAIMDTFRRLTKEPIGPWNDAHSHADVLSMVKSLNI